eukprot:2516299-Amphidinium_carterae.1
MLASKVQLIPLRIEVQSDMNRFGSSHSGFCRPLAQGPLQSAAEFVREQGLHPHSALCKHASPRISLQVLTNEERCLTTPAAECLWLLCKLICTRW